MPERRSKTTTERLHLLEDATDSLSERALLLEGRQDATETRQRAYDAAITLARWIAPTVVAIALGALEVWARSG